MNPEETRAFETLSTAIQKAELGKLQAENNYSQMTNFNNQNSGQNIIEYQLDLKEELDRIYHLLSGHQLIRNLETESDQWLEPDDDRLKIFSDYGVKQIMNIISFYMNRNTLLSNFDEDTINWKIKDFGIEISDLIFNRYESFFYFPSPEELFKKYLPLMKDQGSKISEIELYHKCVEWSRHELQSKFRHYPMIVLALVDNVHATYLRALNGEERESLRKQYNIHQSLNSPINGMPQQGTNFRLIKPSTWGK